MSNIIRYNGKELTLHKSIKNPNFLGKTVLVNDPWDYVEMWLKRNNHNDEAIFYWQQSRQFYYHATFNFRPIDDILLFFKCSKDTINCQ